MAFQDMLDLRCNIYSLEDADTNLGFGLPASEDVTYPSTPTYSNVPTYNSGEEFFNGDVGAGLVTTSRIKFYFLPSQAISLGDIVELDGAYYRAEQPKIVKSHHIEVWCVRGDNFKWLVQA